MKYEKKAKIRIKKITKELNEKRRRKTQEILKRVAGISILGLGIGMAVSLKMREQMRERKNASTKANIFNIKPQV